MPARLRKAVLPMLFVGFAPPNLHAEPRLQDVLSSVTLSFADDGSADRAVLVQGADADADLYLFRHVDDPDAGPAPARPALVKTGLVFAGTSWGQRPSLDQNGKGSLVVKSENDSIGRDRWSQTLTIVLRDGRFLVAGITYSARDTLNPDAAGSCDLNLLTRRGTRNDAPARDVPGPIEVKDWADERLPAACRF